MYVDEQTYLEHYGVKGMRWGIRKEENRDRIRRAGNAIMDTRARAIGGAKTAGKNLKYANVRVNQILKKYNDDGTFKKR